MKMRERTNGITSMTNDSKGRAMVRYRSLCLDEKLREEDQYLAEGNQEWILIRPESIGFTPRRTAAFGTKWRRPYFETDALYSCFLQTDEREVGDMRAAESHSETETKTRGGSSER